MPAFWFTPYDLYCERLGPGFWAEPVNALSNAGFLVAAWLSWRLARSRPGGLTLQGAVLIALVAIIGVGSFLFHTLAVFWAMLTDVIPIATYQVLCLAFYAHSVARWSAMKVAACVGTFLVASVVCASLPAQWLNGTLPYAPALVVIVGMGLYHHQTGEHERRVFLLAAGVFVASLVCRVFDMQVCEHLRIGTHAAWHLLNGVVLYLSTRGFLVNMRPIDPE
jgi:hypothetical protein